MLSKFAKMNRKLKRNVSQAPIPIKVESIKCIRGCMRKEWCVLTMMNHLGKDCVGIKSTQKWLHAVLNGQVHNSKYHNAITNFVSECFDAFREQSEGPSASSQGAPPDAGASNAFLVERSSDSEEETPAKTPAKTRVRRVSTKRRAAKPWTNITVRNMKIEAVRGRGRQLLVPVDTDALDLIVQHLHKRQGEDAPAPDSDFRSLLHKSDEGCIRWRAQRSSKNCGGWQVCFEGENGKAKRYSNGLGVPRRTLSGELRERKEQMEAAGEVLLKARREWNRLDCSARPRFDFDEEDA